MSCRLAMLVAVVAGICSAMPAGAQDIRVGPGGVTIGPDHRDRDRDNTVIIKKDRDHDVDRDRAVKDRDRDEGRDHGR